MGFDSYTDEGNFDIVGNNIPVFFIQDAIKFPDIIHAVKPEPHNEVPTGQSAHNNFWDFVGLQPECTKSKSSPMLHPTNLSLSRPHGDVGDVRPRRSSIFEDDARLWRQYVHLA